MTRRAVVYLERVRGDLLGIRAYVGKDSPARARGWIDSIDQALARLADFPKSGTVPKDRRLAARGFRVIVIGDYLAFYLVKRNRIEIRRVLHGKRRFDFIL